MTAYKEKEQQLLAIIDESLQAVSPEPAMRNALSLSGDTLTVDGRAYDLTAYERILVMGAGKASAAMTATLEDILGDRLQGGVIANKYDHGLPLQKTVVMESGHPVPDRAGERAAKELLAMAEEAGPNDLVFCLLSGGASALVPAPREPVTLAVKQTATRMLLECGATINEINAIRKHLSRFKGGHLAKTLEPATVITLIISDVVGDHLDVIGSGPTAPDASTFLDCQAILDKYSLCATMPDAVTEVIAAGCRGDAPETIKAGDTCFDKMHNVIIAGNTMALDGAARAARTLGYTPMIVNYAMEGEARDVAAGLVRTAGAYCSGLESTPPPVCLLAGGETTVTIKGSGKGGRNQEFALAAAVALSDLDAYKESICLACVGTDGTDGPTDAAGALVFPDTLTGSQHDPATARQYLDDNNAYAFFSGTGTLLKTGPTRTNVMDVAIVLVDPGQPG